MKVVIQNLQKRAGLATELRQEYKPDILLVQEINIQSEQQQNNHKANNPNFHEAHNTSQRSGYGTAIYSCSSSSKIDDNNDVPSTTTPAPPSLTNVRLVNSPHAEFGGFIVKKTTIASCSTTVNNDDVVDIHFVSFHGYNGQPMKSISKLVDHVDTVLQNIPYHKTTSSQDQSSSISTMSTSTSTSMSPPALFAGDFNTWTQDHINAVTTRMEQYGFHLLYSWPYPGRDVPLDHIFVRGLELMTMSSSMRSQGDKDDDDNDNDDDDDGQPIVFQNESDHLGVILNLDLC